MSDLSKLGMGVMIKMLGGNEETVKAVRAVLGKRISKVELKHDAVTISFDDGDQISLWDDGQSCCESRYITCDDLLDQYVGATLLDISIKDAPHAESEWGQHEVQFLELSTDRGAIQFSNHNEHNGYYGGFYIRAARKIQ